LDQMPLYPDEAAIAAAVLGPRRAREWSRIAQHLEDKHGLPPVDTEMGGRFWPAVVAYFRTRHGMHVDGLPPPTASAHSRIRVVPFAPDGNERWPQGDGKVKIKAPNGKTWIEDAKPTDPPSWHRKRKLPPRIPPYVSIR
jgi:hypothetical protein